MQYRASPYYLVIYIDLTDIYLSSTFVYICFIILFMFPYHLSFSYLTQLYVLFINLSFILFFFFFNDPATTEISPLPLHDALPISRPARACWQDRWRTPSSPPSSPAAPIPVPQVAAGRRTPAIPAGGTATRLPRRSEGSRVIPPIDRKSTRLNSSHDQISYAVFCLK